MANKLKITESQFNRIKHRLLLETEDINSTLDYVKVGDTLMFKGSFVLKIKVMNINFSTDEVIGQTIVKKQPRKVMFKLNSYDEINHKFSYSLFDENGQNPVGQTFEPKRLDIDRGGQIVDIPGDASQTQTTGKKSGPVQTPKDDISNPNLIHIGPDEKSPEIHLGGSGKIPTGDEPAEEPETTPEENDEEEDDVDVAKKYYKEIMADPFLKQVFYKYPSTWDYIVAAAKGEKAKGGGLGPALELVDSYKNKRASELTPGFTNKEKKIANFKIKNSINIKFKTISGKSGKVVLNYWDTHEAVVQKYPTIGNSAITTLKNSIKNYKIDILETTEDPNIFVCDFSAYKKGVIEEDTYYSERVNVEFTQSPGYNYINKDNTTNTTTNR